MSGHRASRRQSYGRRQKDVRGRRLDEMVIDLEGPRGWLRASGWEETPSSLDTSAVRRVMRPGGRPDPSLGTAGA